jgi:hypothetical protein
MSPSDQIQDLFDRALASLPEQAVPSSQILHERLSRRRVRSRLSSLDGGALTAARFPRTRQPRLYGGRLRPSIALSALVVVAAAALVTGLLIAGSKSAPAPRSSATPSGSLLSIGGCDRVSIPISLPRSHSFWSSVRHRPCLLFNRCLAGQLLPDHRWRNELGTDGPFAERI